MIKKLLSAAALCLVFGASTAQNAMVAEPATGLVRNATVNYGPSVSGEANKTNVALVADTLWYFFNKHFYRNAAGVGFYTFRSPNTSGATHFGNRFLNTGTMQVNGLECVASKQVGSPSASLTVRMYLCNVVAGQPSFPPIDSVTAVCTATTGTFIGGNFLTGPKTVTSDFAVLYRCYPSVAGDTMRVWMNNANTAASTTTVVGSKYGEGLSHMRIATTFSTMTGLFGAGTDFEFLVAPRVAFQASAASTVVAAPYCTGTPYVFSNTSSGWFKNRQFNLNEFYRMWKPFTNTVTIAPDSVYTWNFGDATGNLYAVNQVHTYAAAGTFNGTLTANYQKMADNFTKATDAQTFSKTVAVCSGIQTLNGVEAINVYPNPSSSGNVTIANLINTNTIELYNMLGQSVYKTTAPAGTFNADFSSLPKGSYFLKITPENEKTKIVKLILN